MTVNAANAPSKRPDRAMFEFIVCPVTKTGLRYDSERNELISDRARLAYPVRGGIPVMVASAARRLDDI